MAMSLRSDVIIRAISSIVLAVNLAWTYFWAFFVGYVSSPLLPIFVLAYIAVHIIALLSPIYAWVISYCALAPLGVR